MTVTATDEISSIVLECGTLTCRVGYSGDDSPQAVFPSDLSAMEDGAYSARLSPSRPLLRPFSLPGRIIDPQQTETIWAEAFSRLRVDPSEYPLFIIDSALPSDNLESARQKALELAFEHFRTPAVYFGKSSVMAAFSMGKHTGMVLEVGAGGTSVVPVYEGIPLQQSAVWSPIGGDYLDEACRSLLSNSDVPLETILTPHYRVRSKQSVGLGLLPSFEPKQDITESPSYRARQEHTILRDLKESVVQVAETGTVGERDLALRPPKYYEFPCGFNRNFGAERFRIGELLMSGTLSSGPDTDMEQSNPGVIGVLKESLNRLAERNDTSLHPQYQHHLTQTLIVSGGGTLLSGFMDRLNYDIQTKLPILGKMRIQAAATPMERRLSPWLGGSVLASLGTMQSFWLTPTEYAEQGAAALSKKFP